MTGTSRSPGRARATLPTPLLLAIALVLAIAQPLARSLPLTEARAATASDCTGGTELKPLIRGLVDRGAVPPAAGMQASAIDVHWADLQPDAPSDPSQPAALVHPNPIDNAISAAGCTVPLRIRVFAGIYAPAWVIAESGGGFAMTNVMGGATGMVGRFWSDDFGMRYDQLQQALAAAYDSVPAVAEVVVSRCTLFYPEPMVRDITSATDTAALLANGYSVAADEACQQEEIASAAAAWTQTRVAVAVNPYQVVNADGTAAVDESFTEQVMAYCRWLLGPRCVLENYSIRDPIGTLGTSYPAMYAALTGASGPVHLTLDGLDQQVVLGAPLAFQTAVAGKVGDLWGTLLWARRQHAASVEMPTDGTFSTSGAAGAPAWTTLPETARWFIEDPAVIPGSLQVVAGAPTTGRPLAQVTLDELAAVDTAQPYGDVGSVPPDTVSGSATFPDLTQQVALASAGGTPAVAATCPLTRWCTVTLTSSGYPVASGTAPGATVGVGIAVAAGPGGPPYLPADAVPLTATVPVTLVPDAPLTITTVTIRVASLHHTTSLSATLTDGDPYGVASDLTALVRWGDGTSSTVPVTAAAGGGFTVAARHTAKRGGLRTVVLTITDVGGSSATAQRTVRVP